MRILGLAGLLGHPNENKITNGKTILFASQNPSAISSLIKNKALIQTKHSRSSTNHAAVRWQAIRDSVVMVWLNISV